MSEAFDTINEGKPRVSMVRIDSYFVERSGPDLVTLGEPIVCSVDEAQQSSTVKEFLEWVDDQTLPNVVSFHAVEHAEAKARGRYIGSIAITPQKPQIYAIEHILSNDYQEPWLATAQRIGKTMSWRERLLESHVPIILPNRNERPEQRATICEGAFVEYTGSGFDARSVLVALRRRDARSVERLLPFGEVQKIYFDLNNLFPNFVFVSESEPAE